jgi:hypothetical protein
MYSTNKIIRTISLIGVCALAVTAARAVSPSPDGGYPNQNSAENEDALYSNTTGSDNALASLIWRATGSLNAARVSHTATLLPDGMVLVAAGRGGPGFGGEPLDSAELYNPASGIWAATGDLDTPRYDHTATLLPNGMVLVAAGFGGETVHAPLASAELYDPATGTWTATGSLSNARYLHTATLLQNGMVLVAGGFGVSGPLASAELYDPATGTWTATGGLNIARYSHTATLLPSGKVLVAGGQLIDSSVSASAELYDPASGTWTATGGLNTAHHSHTATLLRNGKVLVAGGIDSNFLISASAELYDPATGSWTVTGSLNTARYLHAATLLQSGMVLVTGGKGITGPSASAELYDPASRTWTATGSLNTARYLHTATLLENGRILVAGGTDAQGRFTARAELGRRHP